MRGRLWLQTILLFCEGALILVFAYAQTLGGAITTMCLFSIFTQSSEGAIYGIVPYVHKLHTGAVAGFVGSGGNVGSVVYGIGFRNLEYKTAFVMMGSLVIVSSFLSIFIHIPCHAGMLWGEDNNTVLQARERYRRQRERARQAVEERQSRGRLTDTNQNNDGEGGATVESLERAEQGSEGVEESTAVNIQAEETSGDNPIQKKQDDKMEKDM
jgi:hypothetical protein